MHPSQHRLQQKQQPRKKCISRSNIGQRYKKYKNKIGDTAPGAILRAVACTGEATAVGAKHCGSGNNKSNKCRSYHSESKNSRRSNCRRSKSRSSSRKGSNSRSSNSRGSNSRSSNSRGSNSRSSHSRIDMRRGCHRRSKKKLGQQEQEQQ